MSQHDQIYFESVYEGMEMPPLVKTPSTAQLFLFSAVTRNAHRIHYDKDYALSEEHPDVLVQGPLQGAMLCGFVTSWMGQGGLLKRFSYSNRGRAVPRDALTFKGRVVKKFETDGHGAVELDIWVENPSGEAVTPGHALVYLPSSPGAKSRSGERVSQAPSS